MRYHAKFRADWTKCCQYGRPPSWICYTPVCTTHEQYLVVFVTVQNLV